MEVAGVQPAANGSTGVFNFTVGVSREVARRGAQVLTWMADYGVPAAEEEVVLPIVDEEEPRAADEPAADAEAADEELHQEAARGRWLLEKVSRAVNFVRGWVLSAPLYAMCGVFLFALGLGVSMGVWASSPSSVVIRMPLDAGVGGGLLPALDFPRIGDTHAVFNVDRGLGPFGQVLQTRDVSEGNKSSIVTFIAFQAISPLMGAARAPAPEASARNTGDGRRSGPTKTLGNDTPTSKPTRKAWRFWPSPNSSIGEDLASGAWV